MWHAGHPTTTSQDSTFAQEDSFCLVNVSPKCIAHGCSRKPIKSSGGIDIGQGAKAPPFFPARVLKAPPLYQEYIISEREYPIPTV